MLVAGCTSSDNSMKSVYLLSLSYTVDRAPGNSTLQADPDAGSCFANYIANNIDSKRQVNIGFMAMCLQLRSGTWCCGSKAQDMANLIQNQTSSDGDPVNLIWIAEKFRTKIVFDGLM